MAEEFKAEVAKLVEDQIEQNNQSLLASMRELTENTESQQSMQSHTLLRRLNGEGQYKFNTKLADSMVKASEALKTKDINKAQDVLQEG